jgi:hypothetical protein
MKAIPFKACSNCDMVWPTMEDFLGDSNLKLAGYQVHFDDLEGGLILFSHNREDCYTTLAIQVKQFIPLTDRPILNVRTKQPEGCGSLCMREGAFGPCPIKCECSWVREILHKIENWPRNAA